MAEKEIVTSLTVKPPQPDHIHQWVRGLDPWHPDAFKGTPGELPADIVEYVHAAAGLEPQPRKGGWFGEDWSGNAICFVVDGTCCGKVGVEKVPDVPKE